MCSEAVVAFLLQDDEDDNSDLSYESSSSDEDEEYFLFMHHLNRHTNGEYRVPRVKFYAEEVVPRFCPSQFKSHFRMFPGTFQYIEEKISMQLVNLSNHGPQGINPRKQLLMTIWLMATPESYRSVADRFDVSKSTLWTCSRKTIHAISSLGKEIIRWPSVQEMRVNAAEFHKVAQFPGAVSCVDGTFININAPRKHPESYVNRKNDHSVILQGACDYRYRFVDCYAGEVGSLHDARVFRHSKLGRELINTMPEDLHILGDSAYPLSANVMIPFKDNGHLTRRQTNYNYKLSKTRCIIERTFALLKGRFRRLKYLNVCSVKYVPEFIVATCVMHNICQMRNDEIEPDDEDEDDEIVEDPDNMPDVTGIDKRLQIMQQIG